MKPYVRYDPRFRVWCFNWYWPVDRPDLEKIYVYTSWREAMANLWWKMEDPRHLDPWWKPGRIWADYSQVAYRELRDKIRATFGVEVLR